MNHERSEQTEPAGLRAMADRLDCYTQADLREITGWSDETITAYRRRGELEHLRVGKNVLFPRKSFDERMLSSVKAVRRFAVASVL